VAQVQVQHTVHMGEKMPFCPKAKLDDGLVDLVLIRRASRMKLIRVIEAAKVGKHVENNLAEYYQCKTVEIVPDADEPFTGDQSINVDGELVSGVPVRVTAVPAAVRIVTGEPGFGK
jgi:diacylglycerol kinase (ATP)